MIVSENDRFYKEIRADRFQLIFMHDIHHCFICRPSASTVSEDAEIEPCTVATAEWMSDALTNRLDLINNYDVCFSNQYQLDFKSIKIKNNPKYYSKTMIYKNVKSKKILGHIQKLLIRFY